MNKVIDSFSGEYDFLSNFYNCPVEYEDITYLNSEAAFQAAKTLDTNERKEFSDLPPNKAKVKGRQLVLREDWELVKYDVMYDIIKNKFLQNPDLLKKLMATGEAELIEGNWWHDNTWGACKCEKCIEQLKENWLGKILMLFRQEVQRGAHTYD